MKKSLHVFITTVITTLVFLNNKVYAATASYGGGGGGGDNFAVAENAKDFAGIFVVLARLLNLLLGLSGIVFIVTLFMMAIKFATSVDDPRGLEAAKQTGTNAIIGLVVVLGFFFIINAIMSAFGLEGSGLMSPVSTGQSAVSNLLNWFTTAEDTVLTFD